MNRIREVTGRVVFYAAIAPWWVATASTAVFVGVGSAAVSTAIAAVSG